MGPAWTMARALEESRTMAQALEEEEQVVEASP